MSKIHSFLKKIPNKKYCLIIGGRGIENARSPIIWNYIFKKLKLDYKMYPLYAKEDQIKDIFNFLKKDPRFLGGSIAKPHKEISKNYLKLTKLASNIGSVNCIYKNGSNLIGDNTDGYGFIESLKESSNLKSLKNTIVFGYGGVGKSVVGYLDHFLNKKYKIFVYQRNISTKKKRIYFVKFENQRFDIDNTNLVVNCTSLGDISNINSHPPNLTKLNLGKETIFFDVIYNPKLTKFLSYAKLKKFKIINGLQMNLIQAEKAIYNVLKKRISQKNIRSILKNKFSS